MEAHHSGPFDPIFWAFLEIYAPTAPSCWVDLGTGPGLLLRDLRARHPTTRLVGVDAQPAMLARATEVVRELEHAELIDHDLATGAISDLVAGSVDVVTSSMLLHELPVPTALLDEAHRLLRPGGVFFLIDWARFPLARYAAGTRPETLDAFTHFSEHCRYSADDLVWLLERSGFEVLEAMTRRGGSRVSIAARKASPSP
jgi:ubiquinone/menaquinone biosynthesis C-methylase UbiE